MSNNGSGWIKWGILFMALGKIMDGQEEVSLSLKTEAPAEKPEPPRDKDED
jgi:hypothetical protein